MDERMEFVLKAVSSPNFRQLCREYGISAKTGYKWRERFLQHGLAGLNELSRRPKRHPDELSEAVVCEMVRLKQAHPHWGPRKIHALYARRHGPEIPSESSFKRILKSAGYTQKRKLRRRVPCGKPCNCPLAPGTRRERRLGRRPRRPHLRSRRAAWRCRI